MENGMAATEKNARKIHSRMPGLTCLQQQH